MILQSFVVDPQLLHKQRTVSKHGQNAEKDEKGVYEMYYDFQHPINKMVSHRILATNRGEQDILKVALVADEEKSWITYVAN